MSEDIGRYLHKHTTMIVFWMIIMFGILAAGEVLLFRNEMKLNQMLSEGLMQLKENKNTEISVPTPPVILKTFPTK